MSVTEETRAPASLPEINLTTPTDRRTDVEAKHQQVAAFLKEVECDGLLVLQPDNFAWLTAGAAPRGILDQQSTPALYFSQEGRWLVCSNVESQRTFDEELDGLGFQLKEWPWHWGRAQLLADLVQGRNVASDRPYDDCRDVGEALRRMRLTLSSYEVACFRALGQILAHALEATGRTLSRGETEREVAGQISHRLLHRGAIPVQIGVSADGRARYYRNAGFTSAQISNTCVIQATARKYGLCMCASRSVTFGQNDAHFRREHDAACKVSASYAAYSWPDSVPRAILTSGQRIYQLVNAEHEFYLAPQGHIIGRAPVETNLTLQNEELLQANWAVCWHPSVGAAMSCDTFLITDEGARVITAAENWPMKRIRVQGDDYVRPDVLVRT